MSTQALIGQHPKAKVVQVELGEMWTCQGLASVAEAALVLNLLLSRSEPGGVLLLDAQHIPVAHCLASAGLAALDVTELLLAGQPYDPAAVVLWIGGAEQPSWLELRALAGLSKTVDAHWQALDVVIRPIEHPARSVRSMCPCPLPNLRGFRFG